ncbi:MAG: glutamyl-tRNA reductase [Planctomycetota bacterium]
MKLIMLGLSHRTAGVDLRERVAVGEDRLGDLLGAWRAAYPAADFALVSTCNRTELYVARPTHEDPATEDVEAMLADLAGGLSAAERASLRGSLVHREQETALLHLMRVCVGLESMVVGEPQILGQVKRAYESAVSAGSIDGPLHAVFQSAIASGKRARSETGIDAGRRSVGGVAVDLVEQVFESVAGKTVACIGAGEMVKAAARRLVEDKAGRVWVVNRSPGRAADLAESMRLTGERGGPRAWDDLSEVLVGADVVVVGTGASEPVVTAERVSGLIRRRRARPLVVIDVGLPRDVEPAVGGLRNVYLYNLDDLRSVVDGHSSTRNEAVRRCEHLAAESAARCYRELQHRDIGRMVAELRARLETLAEAESRRTAGRLAIDGEGTADGDAMRRTLAEHNHRLINKLLHVPLTQMREAGEQAPLGFYAAALRRLFGLAAPTRATPASDEQPPSTGRAERREVNVVVPPTVPERSS